MCPAPVVTSASKGLGKHKRMDLKSGDCVLGFSAKSVPKPAANIVYDAETEVTEENMIGLSLKGRLTAVLSGKRLLPC